MPCFAHSRFALQLLLILAASLCHTDDLFEPVEEDVEYSSKLATAEQVSEGGCLGPKDAGTEANTHIVVIHFVLLLPRYDLELEESHKVKDDFFVLGRKLVQQVDNEGYLLLGLYC